MGSPDTVDRVLAALGYEMIIDFRDVRPQGAMDIQQVLSILRVYYLCNKDRFGIEKIGIFGSFARGEETPDSDIDIAISLKEPTLFRYSEITMQLQSVFGRKVDLISLKSFLPDSFKEQLEKEIKYVS